MARQRRPLEDLLTPSQKRDASRMAMFFPRVARGHGSQHQTIFVKPIDLTDVVPIEVVGTRCNAKDCHPTEPKHRQDPYFAAVEYVMERDR